MHLAFNRPERVEKLVLINAIAFDDVPADDIKSMQRNTARFALKISRGVLGAAPLMRELLERSVADKANMPDALLARYLAPYVGRYVRPMNVVAVEAQNGRLVMRVEPNRGTPQPAVPLAFYGPDRAVITEGPDEKQSVEFVRAADGAVTWIRVVGRVAKREDH